MSEEACPHETWRRDYAAVEDGMCPLCLAAALAEARRASRTRPDYDLRCTACGAPHWLDTSIPSGVWNRIAGDDEILCVLCIDARVTAAGLTSECEFYFVGAAITSRGYHESFGELAEARRERDEAREAAEYAIERCTESHIIASLPCERCRPWRAALGRPAPDGETR